MAGKKNQLVKRQVTPTRKLTKKQLRELANFTDPGSVLAAFAEEEWTVKDAIKSLVTIAKGEQQGTKTATQLAAIRYLNQLIVDAMERSGLMVIATQKVTGEDGSTMSLSGTLVSSMLGGQKEQTTPEQLIGGNTALQTAETIERGKNDARRIKSTDRPETQEKGEETGSLHSSKSPTGDYAEGGHFDGIAHETNSSFTDATGNFI